MDTQNEKISLILEELTLLKQENEKISLILEELILLKQENKEIKELLFKIFTISKRSETKLTHSMDATGINTFSSNEIDNITIPNICFIQNENNILELKFKHKDITIGDLEKFFNDKNGLFFVTVGEQEWKILK